MLRQNPLQPPRPFLPPFPPHGSAEDPSARLFAAAEDYDATGIMAGVDPCESRYWWMPELHGPDEAAMTAPDQATARLVARPPAAA